MILLFGINNPEKFVFARDALELGKQIMMLGGGCCYRQEKLYAALLMATNNPEHLMPNSHAEILKPLKSLMKI